VHGTLVKIDLPEFGNHVFRVATRLALKRALVPFRVDQLEPDKPHVQFAARTERSVVLSGYCGREHGASMNARFIIGGRLRPVARSHCEAAHTHPLSELAGIQRLATPRARAQRA
jgi:hypothetical protein